MGKHSRAKKFRHRAGLFLFASLCLIAGAFALWAFVLSPDNSGNETVNKADTPSVSQAPEPAKEDAGDKGKAEKKDPAPKPVMVAVPDIPVGATEQEAKKLLESKDLKLGEVSKEANADTEKGGVILQDPWPEKEIKEGSAVDITLSSGPKETDEASADPSAAPTPSSTAMMLTVPKMGKSGQPIGEGVDEGTLYNGPGHAPTTGYPWVPGSNTYIAGHVLGYEGTGSYMDFAALPSMAYGDTITLTDANGTNYNYTVSEILQVSIYDLWVMDPTGKDQVSLQTCINPPAYDVRLVVRGDLTSVDPA